MRGRRTRVLSMIGLMAALGGVTPGGRSSWGQEAAPAPTTSAPTTPTQASAAPDPAQSPAQAGAGLAYAVDLTGVLDSDLKASLIASSSLIALKDDPPPSLIGLERRVEVDRERLMTALRSAGHYDGVLDIRIDVDKRPARVGLLVMPGPVYAFKTIAIRAVGAAALPPATPAPAELGLAPGAPALASTVVEAQTKLLARLAVGGHPFAKVADRQVVVEHATQTMDVAFILDPGPLVRFGAVAIEGGEGVDPELVRARLAWAERAVYDPALVDRARQDIAKLGVFDTVRVQLADQPGPDGVTPVTVHLSERKRHVFGAAVIYSSTDGVGGQAYWGHRDLFGGAEQLRVTLDFGRLGASSGNARGLEQANLRFGANFRKPDFLAPRQSLVLAVSAVSETPPAYARIAGLASGLIERQFLGDRLTMSGGIAAQSGTVRNAEATYSDNLLGVPLAASFDDTGSLLNPSQGFRLTGQIAPWVPLAGSGLKNTLLIGQLGGSGYWDVLGDGDVVAAARLQVGGMSGPGVSAIPPDKRFFAGGGGSVRGYGFQKAGPRNAAGDPEGGRSLLEGGAELRVKVTESIGVVTFVDAGTVYASPLPDFRQPLRVGAGLGARYYTDFGPLRVDVGVPVNRQSGDAAWQLYLSLGQAF